MRPRTRPSPLPPRSRPSLPVAVLFVVTARTHLAVQGDPGSASRAARGVQRGTGMYGPIRKVAPLTAPRLSAVESIARPFTYHVLPLGSSWKVGAPGELQPSSVH